MINQHLLQEGINDNQKMNLMNMFACQDQFTSVSFLDKETNTTNSWSMSTGKLLRSSVETINYNGFKSHSEWNGKHLISKVEETILHHDAKKSSIKRHIWRSITVKDRTAHIEKEFYHEPKSGSKLYISITNDILLEFNEDDVSVYQIKNNKTVIFIDDIKNFYRTDCPKYWSRDFKTYLNFQQNNCQKNKVDPECGGGQPIQIQIWRLKTQNPELYEKPVQLEDIYLPNFNSIAKTK